jgi:DNA-binding beta-propeller fold protein YncE
MLRFFLLLAAVLSLASFGLAQEGPYKILKTVKAGDNGGFDYLYADSDGRRLYIPRTDYVLTDSQGRRLKIPGAGPNARITVYNLDTLEPQGEIPKTNARGVAVDSKSHHAFCTSRPVVMWDSRTLAIIKTIEVEGIPDDILFDPFNQRVWIFSHSQPNATILNANDGSVVGTLDLGGKPEQGVADGRGHVYVDLEDTNRIAAVDAVALKVTAHYGLAGKGNEPTGLAIDAKHHILFAACRHPDAMVILKSDDGKILDALPIGSHNDGAVFNPKTMEAFSSNEDGPFTVIKENSPTSFRVEQNLDTRPGEPCGELHPCAKTLTLDTKTNRIFMIAAEFGPMPANAPKTMFRGPMLPDSVSILVVGK